MVLYITFKASVMDSVTRNSYYKWAWRILRYGTVLVYTPLAIMFPLSYTERFAQTYVQLWSIGAGAGSTVHTIVSVLFYIARNNYLYETSLPFATLEDEFYLYTALEFGVLRSTTLEFKRAFEHFYTTDEVQTEEDAVDF